MKAVFYAARTLDILWWFVVFSLCYASYDGSLLPPWFTLVFVAVRWVIRGLYGVYDGLVLQKYEREHYAG